MTKQEIKEQELPDAVKREALKVSVSDEGTMTVELTSENQIRDLYGTKTDRAASGVFLSAINALGENGKIYRELMVSMAEEMEPRDALEAMLLSQMTATHVAMTFLSTQTIDATSPQLREGYERSMTRLSRTFMAQMDAFKKYRAKAQQTVRLERVTVNEGGQAIVGAVTHGGGGLSVKSDANLIDPTQRLRDAPRCTVKAKRTGERCKCPRFLGGRFVVCMALAVERQEVLSIRTIGTERGRGILWRRSRFAIRPVRPVFRFLRLPAGTQIAHGVLH